MYKIVFYYHDMHSTETYSGGSYIYQGEKFACLDNRNPKLYKTEGIAKRSAQRLYESRCVNLPYDFDDYWIVEEHEQFSE